MDRHARPVVTLAMVDGVAKYRSRWESFEEDKLPPKFGEVTGSIKVPYLYEIEDNVPAEHPARRSFKPEDVVNELVKQALSTFLVTNELTTAAPVDRTAKQGSATNPIEVDSKKGGL